MNLFQLFILFSRLFTTYPYTNVVIRHEERVRCYFFINGMLDFLFIIRILSETYYQHIFILYSIRNTRTQIFQEISRKKIDGLLGPSTQLEELFFDTT